MYHSFRVRACGTCLRFLFADTSVCSLAHGNKQICGWSPASPNLDKLVTQDEEMILLLEYLAGLFSTFVISAAMLSVILTVTTANKAPGHT